MNSYVFISSFSNLSTISSFGFHFELSRASPLASSLTPPLTTSSTNMFGSTSYGSLARLVLPHSHTDLSHLSHRGAFTGFGTPAPTTSQPAPTSLFGAPAASTTPSLFGAPKPATPSLFGAPAPSTPTSQPGGGGGLFGGGATATATLSKPAFSFGAPAAAPAPAGGGLFGQQPQQQQQQPGLSLGGGGGLFGQSTTAAPSGGGGLFGSTTAAGNPSLFGAYVGYVVVLEGKRKELMFGLYGLRRPAPTQQQPQQVQQQAQASSSGLTKATKFNDLPDGARQTIEGIEYAPQGASSDEEHVELT